MKRGQQGAAIAICTLGLVVLAIAGFILVSQLREERADRKRLEEEGVQLRQEIDRLKSRRYNWGFTAVQLSLPKSAEGRAVTITADSLEVTE